MHVHWTMKSSIFANRCQGNKTRTFPKPQTFQRRAFFPAASNWFLTTTSFLSRAFYFALPQFPILFFTASFRRCFGLTLPFLPSMLTLSNSRISSFYSYHIFPSTQNLRHWLDSHFSSKIQTICDAVKHFGF